MPLPIHAHIHPHSTHRPWKEEINARRRVSRSLNHRRGQKRPIGRTKKEKKKKGRSLVS